MTKIIIKPKKAVLVSDKAMVSLLTRKAEYFRENAKLKDATGYVKGTASYCLYGVNHRVSQLVVLADSPTSGDFNQYVTAKAKTEAVKNYDNIIEYRNAGSHSNPKITILCWKLED